MDSWYSTLRRPPLTPPDWVFAPVWTVLYATIAVAVVLYWRSTPKPYVWLTFTVLLLHLLSNFIWTHLFFGLRSPAAALADILFLDLSLVALIVLFGKANRLAGVILVPYLLWVLFATYLNYGFLRLN